MGTSTTYTTISTAWNNNTSTYNSNVYIPPYNTGTTSTYIINPAILPASSWDTVCTSNDIRDMKDTIDQLKDRVKKLSKKAIPRFHCIYCGTQNFEYEGVSTTSQCPNCGALMRKSEESEQLDEDYVPFG